MPTTDLPVSDIPAISRQEAATLAATENQRVVDLLRGLRDPDWERATDCVGWDVRALAGHVLGGFEAFAGVRELAHQMAAARRAAGDGPLVDGMTAVQVRERAGLGTTALLGRLDRAGPAQVRGRSRVPALLRRLPMPQEVEGAKETWRFGYLVDVILTRDTWMHRVDLARATGAPLLLTQEHDGRIVADVVAEWARRHGQAFRLELEGPAGGSYRAGPPDEPAERIRLDAVEMCRALSGRAPALRTGLLVQPVPF